MAYERQGSFDDLNAALFAQMERLADAEDEETVRREIDRSDAVSKLAGNIIGNYRTAVDLMKLQVQEGVELSEVISSRPKMLGGK